MAAAVKKRYCPYTEWKPNGVASRTTVEICENEEKMRRGVHITQIWDGKYWLLNNTGLCQCELIYINDDGVGCTGGLRPDERHERLVAAMMKEVDDGTFKPELWVANFPRRLAELISKH
jgi:hypothetical protein